MARLDFAYPDRRLGIEAEGYRWHSTPRQLDRDRARANRLTLLGWTVLSFSWAELRGSQPLVVRQIGRLLNLGANHSADQSRNAVF